MKFNIRKFRKNMLTLFNWVMTGVFIFSLLTLDSETWIPTFLGFASGLWVAVATYRDEQKTAKRGEEKCSIHLTL